jgi:hypothetical protein
VESLGCLGLFLGFSYLHSSRVPFILNVETGHISPQFHVIFDDNFETVNSLPIDQPLDKQWAAIFWLGRECFLDVDNDENDQPISPFLSDIIKSYSKAQADQPVFEPITNHLTLIAFKSTMHWCLLLMNSYRMAKQQTHSKPGL